jgi:predicted pyridoxine 5'-phosphate oxidase superfamily flavin-nucleotide-binding protein
MSNATRTVAPVAFSTEVSRNQAIVTIDGARHRLERVLAMGESNSKLAKNGTAYRTLGLSMTPFKLDGFGNVCTHASPQCVAFCLNGTGRASFDTTGIIKRGRLARRILWHTEREWVIAKINRELDSATRAARRNGEQVVCRLNVISDIPWERFGIIENHPSVQFYDYTKVTSRYAKYLAGDSFPLNYHLTFSRSENNEADCLRFLAGGGNVTVVFRVSYGARGKSPLPRTWNGFNVVDGDESDLRFLDPAFSVVGLRAKGDAKSKSFGFVVEPS